MGVNLLQAKFVDRYKLLSKPIANRSIIVALFQQPSCTTIKHLAALSYFVIFQLAFDGVIQGVND
jgi:hypothetical protein